MLLTRRSLLASAGALYGAGFIGASPWARSDPAPLPDRRQFQVGDVLWPTSSKNCVALGAAAAVDYPATKEEFQTAKKNFIDAHRSDLTDADIVRLENMSFEEFLNTYYSSKEGIVQLGQTPVVGHVCFVASTSGGKIEILEAQTSREDHARPGVRQIAYDEWLSTYEDVRVWHGRIDQLDEKARAKIVEKASSQLGKPYNIGPSFLDSSLSFYCSKLVLWATWNSAEIALDGDKNMHRWWWVTPADLFRSSAIVKLHNSGQYSCG